MDYKALNYIDVLEQLTESAYIAIFEKRNGDMRVMLCTRDILTYGYGSEKISYELSRVSGRCGVVSGNVPVFDIVLGEGRTINIKRMHRFEKFGIIRDKGELEMAIDGCSVIEQQLQRDYVGVPTMDNIL